MMAASSINEGFIGTPSVTLQTVQWPATPRRRRERTICTGMGDLVHDDAVHRQKQGRPKAEFCRSGMS
jgi:hypothetical protein